MTVMPTGENEKAVLKRIKKCMKKKIIHYEPLEFKKTYREFIKKTKEGEFNLFEKIPENCEEDVLEQHIVLIVKDFLVEHAYYALEKTSIHRRIMNSLGLMDPNNIRVMEIIDYIIENIEKNKLRRLKLFKEKSKFKTYLNTVVSSLLMDYWRQYYKIAGNVSKYDRDFEEIFDKPQKDPLESLLQLENEEDRQLAREILPLLLNQLDSEERRVIKLKYEKDLKLSMIARALNKSRFKTGQFIKQIEHHITVQLLAEIKQRRDICRRQKGK